MASTNNFVLLAVDTAGIQSYIFNSNRLKENIGASYLVAAATEDWALEAIRNAANGSHNLGDNGEVDDSLAIEQHDLSAEVLYAGGGNFIVLFRNDAARSFTSHLSRHVLEEAPGLRLMIHSLPFTWGQDVFGERLGKLLQEMKEKRSLQRSVMPLAGLGVTVMCRSTALPAVDRTDEPRREDRRPASSEVLAKHRAADGANDMLQHALPPGDYAYPADLDDLGRVRGESSLIAVVHADGDGIGKRIEAIGEQYRQPEQAREHITALRRFSRDLEKAAEGALKETVDKLKKFIQLKGNQFNEDPAHENLTDDERAFIQALLEGKRSSDGKSFLPFRPLVFGGDDVTFVCNGRIGLSLTLEYLRQFEKQTAEHLRERLTACAGVAIVKSHFPFARAYDLAEQLTRSAKKYKRDLNSDRSFIDWHFTTSGISSNLEGIRDREYEVPAGSMTLRPVAAGGAEMRSWSTVEAGLQKFQGEDWQGRRNKAKALREKLRGGPNAVREFTVIYGDELPEIAAFEHGWARLEEEDKRYCGYFDALELMDLHLPLAEQN